VFVTDCGVRLDSIALLSRCRGAQFPTDPVGRNDQSSQWTVQWTDGAQIRRRTLALQVTTTAQRLVEFAAGGAGPACGRRCRLLLAIAPEAPIACRLCLAVRYASDYPARDRRQRLVALVHSLGQGVLDADDERELDSLLARRRRGIRRRSTRPAARRPSAGPPPGSV
jgi:hypothetical protein